MSDPLPRPGKQAPSNPAANGGGEGKRPVKPPHPAAVPRPGLSRGWYIPPDKSKGFVLLGRRPPRARAKPNQPPPSGPSADGTTPGETGGRA